MRLLGHVHITMWSGESMCGRANVWVRACNITGASALLGQGTTTAPQSLAQCVGGLSFEFKLVEEVTKSILLALRPTARPAATHAVGLAERVAALKQLLQKVSPPLSWILAMLMACRSRCVHCILCLKLS